MPTRWFEIRSWKLGAAVLVALIAAGVIMTTSFDPAWSQQRPVQCPIGEWSLYKPSVDEPFHLDSVFCLIASPDSSTFSPDGRAAVRDLGKGGFAVFPLEKRSLFLPPPGTPEPIKSATYDIHVGGMLGVNSDAPAWAWDADSRGVWAFTRADPPSIAKLAEGHIEKTSSPSIDGHPLRSLIWAPGGRFALGQFDEFSRAPMRVKSTPILAFVDGETGQVIERFPSDLLPKEAVSDEWGWSVERAAVTRGPNGKLYSVIFIEGGWIYWVQGESPKYVPQPFPSDRFSRMALSPDGKTVLIQHDLRPLGIVYDLPIGMRGPKLTPVTGVREALHDAATGVPRWTISETVVAPSDHNSPVISSDGKFGLLALATEPNDKLRRGISVVDMENGRVLEVLPTYGTYNYSFGFAGAGSLIWISQVLVTALYERR